LSFDGKSTSISLGTLASLGLSTTSFTIEAWFRVSEELPTDGTLLCVETPGGATAEPTLSLRIASTTLEASLTGVADRVVELGPVYPGWHHVAIAYARESGGVVSVRVDGVLEARIGIAGDLPETTMLRVGAPPGGTAWKGQLAELRVWSMVRGRDDVQGLMYRRLSGMEPELACYLPLDLVAPDTTSLARDARVELDPTTGEPTSMARAGKTIVDGVEGDPGVPLHALASDDPAAPAPVVVGEFDGRTSVVATPYSTALAATPQLTVEAWVRPTGVSRAPSWYPVASTRGESAGWELRAGAGHASFLVQAGEKATVVSATLATGHWAHLAGVYDGERVVLYVNGVALAAAFATGTITDGHLPLELGRSSADAERRFVGQLAEARVWSVARSQAELQRDRCERLVGQPPGLVARCSLEGDARDTSASALPWTSNGVRWCRSGAPFERSAERVVALVDASEPLALLARNDEIAKQLETLGADKRALEREVAELEAAAQQPAPVLRRPAVSEDAPTVGEGVPSMPIGELVRSMATAIADAQFDLDKSSLMVAEFMSGHYPLRDRKTGELVDEQGQAVTQPVMVDSRVYFGHHVEDGKRVPHLVSMMELGFVPNFYQFVDTVLEVKIAMKLERSARSVDPRTGRIAEPGGRASDVKLSTTPIDAGYASAYGYDVAQSSVFKTKLVCVPPPVALEERLREVIRQEARAAAVEPSIAPEEASE
ncbi:MAG: LamG domain-containing protein, partial [Myxococcales bacterium]|nr:LamG domain-containing protein [Myxococcales bacterium]